MNKFRLFYLNLLVFFSIIAVAEFSSSLLALVKLNRKTSIQVIASKVKSKLTKDCTNYEEVRIKSDFEVIDHPLLGRYGYPNATITYSIKNNTFNAGTYTWIESTGKYGNRITSSNSSKSSSENKKTILILGDSFIRGHAINDSGSFPWILQSLNSDFDVWNFARGGSGTIHQSIMLKDALSENKLIPLHLSNNLRDGFIVLGYGDYYDKRNTVNIKSKKNLEDYKKCSKSFINGNRFYRPTWNEGDPAAKINSQGIMSIQKISNIMKVSSDKEIRKMSDEDYRSKISILLMKEAIKSVRALGATPIIAYLKGGDDNSVIKMLHSAEVKVLDFRSKSKIHDSDNLLPFDYHPGYLSHQTWAQKINIYLNSITDQK